MAEVDVRSPSSTSEPPPGSWALVYREVTRELDWAPAAPTHVSVLEQCKSFEVVSGTILIVSRNTNCGVDVLVQAEIAPSSVVSAFKASLCGPKVKEDDPVVKKCDLNFSFAPVLYFLPR